MASLGAVALLGAAAVLVVSRSPAVTESDLAVEREIARDQAAKAGKPPAVVEKIVEGKMEKYYADNCLVEQAFVKDPDRTVGQVVADASARAGGALQVRRFVRFVLGESVSA